MKFNRSFSFISNPKFLFYFLPYKLQQTDSKFSCVIFSLRKKKSLDIEISNFGFSNVQQSLNFLTNLDNRYLTYKDSPFFEKQEASLFFQSLDFFTKSLLFTQKKRRMMGYTRLINILKEKEEVFNTFPIKFLLKSRLLRLVKGGFVSSCFTGSAFLIKSSLYYRFCKHRFFKGWFFFNMLYYGFLSVFRLISFSQKSKLFTKTRDNKLISRRMRFYYFKNEIFYFSMLLGKPSISCLL